MASERLPAVSSPALAAFAGVATEFCSVIESHRELGREAFLRDVHLALAKLYLAGLQLPVTAILFKTDEESTAEAAAGEEVPADSEANPDRQSRDEAASLCLSLGELIGQRNLYRTVFDPYQLLTEPEMMGTLADDFADIYRDLHEGLVKWRRGESGDALWDWRFGLDHHWGRHAVEALHALYVLNASYEFNWPTEQLPRE